MTDPPVSPPDTELARWAAELLHGSCDPQVAADCERSFQFAGLLARSDDLAVDLEVVYIGTVLHDVGLTRRFAGPDRFEMRGANAARTLLLEAGMDPVRVGNVWDVIALHASTAIAAHKSPETRLANRGISIDVRGVGVDGLAPADVRAVLDVWPCAMFPAEFAELLIEEVRAHPASVRLSWMESIAASHVPGFECADFLATLHASSTFV